MPPTFTRREFLAGTTGAALPLALRQASDADPLETATIAEGDLTVTLRDNSSSPKVLSGVDALFHRATPTFDAFDPDSPGASASLNFEHITCGHPSPNNAFTPRQGTFVMSLSRDGKSATLARDHRDDPWAMSSRLTYTVTKPHYIDMDFRCTPHDRALFGERGYALLFFANYMNDVEQTALHFRGIEKPDGDEQWIAADAPKGHADWNQGGSYRSRAASDLEYDADHNFKLNSWSYDYPRFTQPFYYGRAANGMVYLLMFDRAFTDEDEIRFSLYKFKLPRVPRPAWDFEYVIRGIREGREYGFRTRAVWKPFVSAEDCLEEYARWKGLIG